MKSEERRVKKQRSAAERESQFNSFTEVSHVVQVRAEGPKAPSPGHRPGYNGNQQGALTGRQFCVHKHPGRCPGRALKKSLYGLC